MLQKLCDTLHHCFIMTQYSQREWFTNLPWCDILWNKAQSKDPRHIWSTDILCLFSEQEKNTDCSVVGWMFSQAGAGYGNSQVLYSLIFCLETPKKSSGPTILAQVQHTLIRSISCELVSNFISCTPACSGTLYSPKVCQVEILFNAFLHFRTKRYIVLAAWINFRATCLSQQILTYFSGLSWVSVSWTHANIAYTLAWKTVQCFPREMLSLLPTDCPYTPTPVTSTVLDPSINQNSPLTTGEVSGPLVHSSVVNIVTLYLGSSLKTCSLQVNQESKINRRYLTDPEWLNLTPKNCGSKKPRRFLLIFNA